MVPKAELSHAIDHARAPRSPSMFVSWIHYFLADAHVCSFSLLCFLVHDLLLRMKKTMHVGLWNTCNIKGCSDPSHDAFPSTSFEPDARTRSLIHGKKDKKNVVTLVHLALVVMHSFFFLIWRSPDLIHPTESRTEIAEGTCHISSFAPVKNSSG
jgi:hypothetical protein